MTKNNKISLGRLLAFSAPSLPLAALGLPLVIQLPPFYTNYVGLSLAVVGTVFMAARLLDIFVDLAIGSLMDRTKTKYGRFSPWLVIGAPILALCAWFLFMAKPGASAVYLAISLFTTYVLFSVCTLAQLGVGSSLSSDYNERSRIFSFWQIGNIVGMLLVLALPVLVSKFGGTNDDGVRAMGFFIITMMPISALISLALAKEGPFIENKHEGINLKDLFALVSLVSFRRVLASDFILSFSSGVVGGLFLFFLASVKNYDALGSALLLVYFISGLIFTPLWVKISHKFGKHNALKYSAIYYIFAQVFIYFMPQNNFALATMCVALVGLAYAAPLYLIRAMVADVGDEDKLVTGKDRTGMLFALVSLTSKIGYAFSVGITYILLSKIGYDPKLGLTNSVNSIHGLELIFFIFPSLCQAICAFLMVKYPLDLKRVEEVQAQLNDKIK